MINKAMARAAIRRLMPGAESGFLRVRNDTATGWTDYALPAMHKRRPGAEIDQAEPGASEKVSARWVLRQDTLSAASAPDPRVGDMLVQATGEIWTIQSIDKLLFDQAINCHCVRAL